MFLILVILCTAQVGVAYSDVQLPLWQSSVWCGLAGFPTINMTYQEKLVAGLVCVYMCVGGWVGGWVGMYVHDCCCVLLCIVHSVFNSTLALEGP